MEFASIEDAFPQDAFPQSEKSKEKRRHKKKEGFQAYELPPTDADRPAVKRMLEIPPINTIPSEEDEYLDESSKQLKKATVNNSLPPPRSSFTQNSSTPSFFGAEPFSNPSEDMHAIYNSNTHKQSGYMLEADFTKSFEESGFGKSAGKMVPTPELRQRWKPLSAERIDSSFTNDSKGHFEGLSSHDILAMRSKIDTLMARLDDLESRAEGANPQLEMLSFIMTGLFLMFALDLTVKKLAR
uniref:Uncharacterized protein n=1 Tax=viral metagenome TaxID=1070528 RepID=A0A6C0APC4_9ZZZZ